MPERGPIGFSKILFADAKASLCEVPSPTDVPTASLTFSPARLMCCAVASSGRTKFCLSKAFLTLNFAYCETCLYKTLEYFTNKRDV